MAYLYFRGCKHLKYTKPPRTLATYPREGLCPECVRKRRLSGSFLAVEVRKTLFVHVSAADKNTRCVYGERFDPPFSMRDQRRKGSARG